MTAGRSFSWLGGLLLATLACALEPPAAPTPLPLPGPPATAEPLSGTPRPVELADRPLFAAYAPVPVDDELSAPAYSVSLSAVANPGALQPLGGAQRSQLSKSGFVVVPDGRLQIYDIYRELENDGRPAFVTTDAVLHAFHVLNSYAWQRLEAGFLMADLAALNEGMVAAAQAQLDAAGGTVVEQAAWRNLAFFSIAGRLLNPDYAVAPVVVGIVNDELSLIAQAAGVFNSPLSGRAEDYSPYRPRGHYTRSDAFSRYFRAMVWYDRMSLPFQGADGEAQRMWARQSLLVLNALESGDNFGRWAAIYLPTAFFAGAADDLTLYDLQAAARAVYGDLPGVLDLDDRPALDGFIATVQAMPPPQVLGQPAVGDAEGARVFRFMGQRLVPDSAVMQQVVFNRVGVYSGEADEAPFTAVSSGVGLIRAFPRGLDVAAAFGSDRALELLRQAGDTAYEGYDGQMAGLRAHFDAFDQAAWTQNLYWGWLYSLQPLLAEPADGQPFFMDNAAWGDKQLNTWLGSWTELRHDSRLHASQGVAGPGTGPGPAQPARGYVEPAPHLYGRLAAVTRQMVSGLDQRGLLDKEMGEKLLAMERLLLTLKHISEKELQGDAVTAAEFSLIGGVGGTLEGLTRLAAESDGGLASEADERLALVTDVHADPNSGRVLQAAVGDAWPIYVIVPVDGEVVVAVGAVYSTYEFIRPAGERLSDEEWQAQPETERPEPPAWTASFVVP